MIWRLTYCNKNGVEARVDIIKGDRTSIEIVEGSANPFTISYKLDKNDKSGHIMTSSADIEIFETETFNIDDLKTSNETELKVEYFEDNVLTWSGFILPDFFSREIGSPNIVRMTASDRLTALKGVILSDLPAKISLRDLIELSLAQTGLSLGLVAQIQINQGSTNILDSEILSQRLTDTRGRSISCYDILMSIMVATNSTIRQRAGQWVVYNKLEHELRTPTIFFDKVERGAIRTIQPVASSVGVYQEFGGGRSYPDNHDFSLGLNGWIENSGFNAVVDNRKVDKFILSGGAYIPDYGEETSNSYLVNRNYIYLDIAGRGGQPRLSATDISVVGNNPKEVSMSLNVNMTGKNNTRVPISVCVFTGSRRIWLNKDGVLQDTYTVIDVYFKDESKQDTSAIMAGLLLNTTIKADNDEDDVTDYHVEIDIYGAGSKTSYAGGEIISDITVLVNSISVRFSSTSSEVPKGNIFKTTQGSNFTKLHDVETTIFGDYITSGLNGYFYNYPIDDTSNLYLPSGELSSPIWITLFDTTERPLLHHISRQKSRLFSVAHDILKANINVESFDPLAVFQDCKGGKYVVVSARFDFLRSEVDVELEQIAYDNTILKRDFIYSYFGEGEDSIKSIGGIAGGGGTGGGGGMTSEQLEMLTNLADWWKLDEENDAIYSEKSIYSLKGVSALGYGDGGGSGGGDIDMLDSWENYIPAKANYYVPASLLVPFRNDTLSRLTSLESGSATSITTTGSGNAITSLTKSGTVITANKELTFALASHTHTIAQITGLQGALDLKATQSDIDTAIDNLEIGGRNLIVLNKTISGVTIDLDNGSVTSVGGGNHTATDFIAVVPSERYIISVHPPKDGYQEAQIGKLAFYDDNKDFISAVSLPTISTINPYIFESTANTAFIRYSTNTNYALPIEFIKLEKGNKPTDWTPAPEDQVSDWSVTDVNSFAFIKNKPTQLSQFTDNIGVGSHIANTSNPHSVTKAQVGLGNVDNVKQATKSEFDTHTGNTTVHITSNERTNWNLAYTNNHTHGNKSVIDALTQGHINVLNKLSLDEQGNVKVDATLWATGGISALGLGEGGSGGDFDRLDDWADYDSTKSGWVLSALLGVDLNNRLSNVEGGSATSVSVTGTGDVIVGGSKSGNVITLTRGNQSWDNLSGKPSAFTPSAHIHSISDITGLQGALDSKQPTISTGTTSQYYRGDKTWQTLNTSVVPEGTNLYFTNARVKTYGDTLYSPLGHTHTIAQITGLQGVLDSKLNLTGGVISGEIIRNSTSSLNSNIIQVTRATNAGVAPVRMTLVDYDIGIGLSGTGQLITGSWESITNLSNTWDVIYHTGNLTSLSQLTDNIGVATHIANTSNPHNVTKAQVGLGNVDNTADSAKNVLSATKLTTARTIAGVSFDGTADIAIPFANLSSKPTTLSGYGITDAVTLNTAQTITGAKTFNTGIKVSQTSYEDFIVFERGASLWSFGMPTNNLVISNGDITDQSNRLITIGSNGNIRIGDYTASALYKLTVIGTGGFTGNLTASAGVNTPKVDFGNGFTIEPSGTELVFKYNDVIKQRMLSDGTILATGGVTALATS